MKKMFLADALLRRKELQAKVDQLRQIDAKALYEVQVERVGVTESVDNIVAKVPKLTASQVTAEYDHYASQLRRIDAIIQRTNWTTEVEVGDDVVRAFGGPVVCDCESVSAAEPTA